MTTYKKLSHGEQDEFNKPTVTRESEVKKKLSLHIYCPKTICY